MSDLQTPVDPHPPFIARLLEEATFCRLGDEKRPGLVGLPDFTATQICPLDLAKPAERLNAVEGAPPSWWVHIVFDRLLKASTVEDLIPQDPSNPMGPQKGTFLGPNNTTPVTLKCNNVDVPYDGFYQPGGNGVAYPPGPNLFIKPLNLLTIPVGATCEVGLKDTIRSKTGESVPTEQRSYMFKVGAMDLRFTDPEPAADGSDVQDVDTPLLFYFKAPIANTGLPPVAQIQIFEGADASICAAGGTRIPDAEVDVARAGAGAETTALVMVLATTSDAEHAWKPSTQYRVEFGATATVTPAQGGTAKNLSGTKLCFKTSAAM